jgi:hypothetical protein
VLDINKYGGSKGTGKILLAITPPISEKSLYLNAYRWMPRLLDAVIEENSELSQYHIISTLIKALSAFDDQALRDVYESSTASAIADSRRMDHNSQGNDVRCASLTYSV